MILYGSVFVSQVHTKIHSIRSMNLADLHVSAIIELWDSFIVLNILPTYPSLYTNTQ